MYLNRKLINGSRTDWRRLWSSLNMKTCRNIKEKWFIYLFVFCSSFLIVVCLFGSVKVFVLNQGMKTSSFSHFSDGLVNIAKPWKEKEGRISTNDRDNSQISTRFLLFFIMICSRQSVCVLHPDMWPSNMPVIPHFLGGCNRSLHPRIVEPRVQLHTGAPAYSLAGSPHGF